MLNNIEQVSSQARSGENGVATALGVIAWIAYIGGFFAGVVFAFVKNLYATSIGTYYKDEFSFTIALAIWVSSFVTGTIFLGFAEVIKLLQELVDKRKPYIIKNSINTINKDTIEPESYHDLPKL